MAFTIRRLSGQQIYVVRGEGDGHVGESQTILDELRRLITPADRAAVLFDLRALRYIPTAAEARYIGERYGDVGVSYGLQMAYLAPPGAAFGVARSIEIMSGLRGAVARVFSDEEEALAWLREGQRQTGRTERKLS
jgi:hypothetical protein